MGDYKCYKYLPFSKIVIQILKSCADITPVITHENSLTECSEMAQSE